MGRLFTPLLFIIISFITRNQFSIFQLISYQVTTLRLFYIKSSVLQFFILTTKSIASQLIYKGHNSIIYFNICLSQLYLYIKLLTGISIQQSQSFSFIISVFKSVTIIFSAFVRPFQSPKVLTMIQLRFLLLQLTFIPLTFVYLFSVSPVSIIL